MDLQLPYPVVAVTGGLATWLITTRLPRSSFKQACASACRGFV